MLPFCWRPALQLFGRPFRYAETARILIPIDAVLVCSPRRQPLVLNKLSTVNFHKPPPTGLCIVVALVVKRIKPWHVESFPIRISEQTVQHEIGHVASCGLVPIIVYRPSCGTIIGELRNEDRNCCLPLRDDLIYQLGITVSFVLQPTLSTTRRVRCHFIKLPEGKFFQGLACGLAQATSARQQRTQNGGGDCGASKVRHASILTL